MKSSEKSWEAVSAVEKAMTYAGEYQANPGEYDSIHKHWLVVLADEINRLRAQISVLEDGSRKILGKAGKLREALRNVLEQNDLSCMRASEEISMAEGCPCPNCIAERIIGPHS